MEDPRAGSLCGARVFLPAGVYRRTRAADGGKGGAGPARRGGATAAGLALLAAALCLGGCERPEASAKSETIYPYRADSARVFYAGASGLSEMLPGGGPAAGGASAASGSGSSRGQAAGGGSPAAKAGPGAGAAAPGAPVGLPASEAPNASILSSDGKTILAAVNGWGVVRIQAAPASPAAKAAYRIAGTELTPIFAGLTAAGAWPVSGGFLVQLYRDPFAGPTSGPRATAGPAPKPRPEVPGSRRLAFFPDDGGEPRSLDPFATEEVGGYELFVLLPSGSRWFAELRKDADERVDLKFLSVGNPVSGGAVERIQRSRFEEALRPRPMGALAGAEGERLGAALGALGKGPWLVRLRSAEGRDDWYLSAGKAEEASPIYAWSSAEGVLALRSDGWLALADASGGTELASLGEKAPGATFVALAQAGPLVATAWESGDFPNLVEAGLVVSPLPQ